MSSRDGRKEMSLLIETICLPQPMMTSKTLCTSTTDTEMYERIKTNMLKLKQTIVSFYSNSSLNTNSNSITMLQVEGEAVMVKITQYW